MSTKRTKAEKGQRKADELEKRFDDRPDNQEDAAEREKPDQAHNDSDKR